MRRASAGARRAALSRAAALALAAGLAPALCGAAARLAGAAEAPDPAKVLAQGAGKAALAVLGASLLPLLAAAAAAAVFAAAAGPGVLSAVLRVPAPSRRRAGEAALSFLAGALACAPAAIAVSGAAGLALESLGFEPSPQFAVELFSSPDAGTAVRLAIAFSVVVVSPVAEEVLYRAFLWRGARAWVARLAGLPEVSPRVAAAATALSSLFFAAIHSNLFAFAPLALFAVVLAETFRRTSLPNAVALHSGFNAASCLLALAG